MAADEREIQKMASEVHKGHRQRMIERFLKQGFDGFNQHEILEMLLFYTIPRVNTNPLAHRLIDRYGSLNGVFDADISDLLKVEGVTMNTAAFLKAMPQIANIYAVHRSENVILDSTAKARSFFHSQFIGVKNEQFRVACLDSSMRVITCTVISQGDSSRVEVSPRRLAEAVLRSRSNSIFIAHNHPDGIAEASSEDVATTRSLISIMKSLDICLLDHIIVSEGVTVSLKESGFFSVFDC